MGRIIRVTSCADCPFHACLWIQEYICNHPINKYSPNKKFIVTEEEAKMGFRNETLPDNCPLEKEMTKVKLATLEEETARYGSVTEGSPVRVK